jgi:hypothetical protein
MPVQVQVPQSMASRAAAKRPTNINQQHNNFYGRRNA